jgi:hypothetical protein
VATRLEALIEEETGRPLSPAEQEDLDETLRHDLFNLYQGGRKPRQAIIGEPNIRALVRRRGRRANRRSLLDEVIDLLERDANLGVVLQALGGSDQSGDRHHRGPNDKSRARYEALINDLQAIRMAASKPLPNRGARRPGGPAHAAAWRLISCWERITGKPFAADWRAGEPLTHGTKFLTEAFKVLDPDWIDQPGALKSVVDDLLPCWRDSRDRSDSLQELARKMRAHFEESRGSP